MKSLISEAVKSGVEDGLFSAYAAKIEEMGDCYDEPQDRCVMRPQDGCACLYLRWQRLPWYRRMFTKEPKRPDARCVGNAVYNLMVEEAVSDLRIAERKVMKSRKPAKTEPTL